MYLKEDSLYLNGIFDMVSHNMSVSYTDILCLSKDNFLNTFLDLYKIKDKKIELVEENNNLKELLTSLFEIKDKELNRILYLLEKECGKYNKTYSFKENKIYDYLSRKTMFYFLEDIYFIEFDKKVICLMIGNNE